MGAKSEALAKKFEAKAQEATGVLNHLSDADWKKTATAEKWTVGVVANHFAGSHETIAGIVQAIALGKPMPSLTMDMLNEMNNKRAKEAANCTKAETVALHTKGAAAAAAIIRGLDDAGLDKTATVLQGMPAMSATQFVEGVLIGHIDEHLGSIKKTVGA